MFSDRAWSRLPFDPVHWRFDPSLAQALGVPDTHVLRPGVRIMKQIVAMDWATSPDNPAERVQREAGLGSVVDPTANNKVSVSAEQEHCTGKLSSCRQIDKIGAVGTGE